MPAKRPDGDLPAKGTPPKTLHLGFDTHWIVLGAATTVSFTTALLSAIELADGSITSQFLEMFGRPSRDTGLESERNNQPTDAQRLHLLNSSHVQDKIERSSRLNGLIRTAKGNRRMLINLIYLNILSRYATQVELAAAEKYFQTKGISSRQATSDLAWALINTKEFLYRH